MTQILPTAAALFDTAAALFVNMARDAIEARSLFTVALRVVFLVEGAAKAAAVASVLEGPYQPDRYPAQLIRPDDGELVWLLDAAAAARLGGRSSPSVSDPM